MHVIQYILHVCITEQMIMMMVRYNYNLYYYNLCTLQKMHFLVCQVDCLVASMLTVLHLEQKGKEIHLQKGNDT